MNVCAIDQSLTNSGIAIWEAKEGYIRTDSIKPSPLMGVNRLKFIEGKIVEIIEVCSIDTLVMEGYNMGLSQYGRVFDLGELGGIIKRICYSRNIPCYSIPPTSHKKYTTGKGNSPKNIMIKEVLKKYYIDTNDENIADAISLLKTFLGWVEWQKHPKEDPTEVFKKLNEYFEEQRELGYIIS